MSCVSSDYVYRVLHKETVTCEIAGTEKGHTDSGGSILKKRSLSSGIN